jgi:hypothetical protein
MEQPGAKHIKHRIARGFPSVCSGSRAPAFVNITLRAGARRHGAIARSAITHSAVGSSAVKHGAIQYFTRLFSQGRQHEVSRRPVAA